MDEIVEREKLTPEALNEYMEQVYIDDTLIAAYFFSLEKEINGSLQAYYDEVKYKWHYWRLWKRSIKRI